MQLLQLEKMEQQLQKKLPLGKYDVTEVKAPEGYIVNGETKHLELKYKDQNTPLVFDSATISNARQTVDIELIKKDKDTGEALSGAVFGLSSKQIFIHMTANC